MPTLLPSWRSFSLRGCSEAARQSLGGDLRVEGKEKKKSVSRLLNRPPATEERHRAWGGPASVSKGEGPRYRKRDPGSEGSGDRGQSQLAGVQRARDEPVRAPSPLPPPDLPSPLSGACHPSGSLCSFWGHYPLGCQSCHTNQGMMMGSCSPDSPHMGWKNYSPILSLKYKNKQDRPRDQIGGNIGGIKY